MSKQLEVLKTMRGNFLKLVDGLSIEKLNEIPKGLKNNVAWNFGHIIATQQGLCYMRAGVEPRIDKSFIKKYGRDTKPEAFIDAAEIEILKGYLFSLIDLTKEDMQTDMFKGYEAFTTGLGIEVTSVEDAVTFCTVHEALHFGYAMSIRRMIQE